MTGTSLQQQGIYANCRQIKTSDNMALHHLNYWGSSNSGPLVLFQRSLLLSYTQEVRKKRIGQIGKKIYLVFYNRHTHISHVHFYNAYSSDEDH